MSDRNVQQFIAVGEAFNRRDVQGLLAVIDPEVVFEPQQTVLQGTYVGHEGVVRWLLDLAGVYEDGRLEFNDIRAVGERVLGLGILHFVGKGSGIETDVPLGMVADFRDGLITRFKDYGDRDEALAAVGLAD